MSTRRDNADIRQPRPDKGRLLFHHRDSGGGHETTPGEYIRCAQTYSKQQGLTFTGTPEQINSMIETHTAVAGDVFLDWDVSGNKLSRTTLDALFEEIERDRTVTHVFIPRPDRLARPSEIEKGIALERRFRQTLGVWLVFMNRACPPIKRGSMMPMSDWLQSALEYEQAGKFRQELAEKMLLSQVSLARRGFSTGGRAKYGLQRWLVDPNGKTERMLADGDVTRRAGYHVVWLPKDDGTFEIRQRIKQQLITTPASQLARQLTIAGVRTPDCGRVRRDNDFLHTTSGVWHATTLTNIGRDSIDAGLTSYGRRSMGDQLRFSETGPRELEDHDFRSDDQTPKVIRNHPQQIISGPAHFKPAISADTQTKLNAILDKRGGTQRGKPRSRQPQQNPLGARIFDMACGWPMYRVPYNGSFRYTCGFYQQSHGAECHHNLADGPQAVSFLLSCAQQYLFPAGRMEKLEVKLREIAAREAKPSNAESALDRTRKEILAIDQKLQTVSRNLALAETAEAHASISAIFHELQVCVRPTTPSRRRPKSPPCGPTGGNAWTQSQRIPRPRPGGNESSPSRPVDSQFGHGAGSMDAMSIHFTGGARGWVFRRWRQGVEDVHGRPSRSLSRSWSLSHR